MQAEIVRTAEDNMAMLAPRETQFQWIDGQPLGVKKRLAAYNRSRLVFGFECLAQASLSEDLFTDEVADEDILEAFGVCVLVGVCNCCRALWCCVRTPVY